MFPPSGAEIYRNEAGEPLGWNVPEDGPPYCDICGFNHIGLCEPWPEEEDDEDEG
jgi:hypothetical protein